MSSTSSRLPASSSQSHACTVAPRPGGARALRIGVLLFLAVALSPHAVQAQTYGTISPGSLTTTAPTQAYTIDACSVDDGVLLRPTMFVVKLDGVAISPSAITPVTVAGCYDAYQITGTASLVQHQPNKLSSFVVAWGNHTASDTAKYTYQFIKPFISTSDWWGSTLPGFTSSKTFTVRNDGNVTGTIALGSTCDALLISHCDPVSPASVTLDSGQTQNVTVPYQSAVAGGTGSLTLRATGADASALYTSLTEPLPVSAPLTSVMVDPPVGDGRSATVLPGVLNTLHFTVRNLGGNYAETVQVVPACLSGSTSIPSCGVASSTIVVAASGATGVDVSFYAPNSAGVSGTISLQASVPGTSVSDVGRYSYTTAVNTQFFYMNLPSDTILLAPEKSKTVLGRITNFSGRDSYSFAATHCDSLAVGSCPAPAMLGPIDSLGNAPFSVTFRASTHLGQQGNMTVTAASTLVVTSTSTTVIPVRTRDRYVIMPRTASMVLAPGADSAFYFNIQQQEATGTGFQVHLVCPALVTCYTTAQGTIPAEPGFGFASISATYPVTIHAGAVADTGTLIVIATDYPSGTPDSAFYRIAVGTAPPPPPRPHTAPFVTIAAEQGDWRFKDTSKCLLDCFDVMRRFTTTPYVSLNTPRSLTFTQRRIGYQPAMMLEFDVADSSSSPADSFSVAIRRSNGSLMPLVYAVDMAPFGNGINTRDTIYYRRGGASRFRVAVSPSIATDATGVYDATAIISGIWSASEIKVRELPIHYVVRNDSASIFGKGVTLEGQQSLKHVSGGKLILDGSGGWTYFMRAMPACVTACVYQHTPGDFSVLHDSVVAGAVVGYVRVYPDASQITFDAAGRILTASDPSGNTTSYSYGTVNSTPVLTSIIDPAGKVDSLRYARVFLDDECACLSRTFLSGVRDPGGRVTGVAISYQGDPVFVDPDGGGTALSAPWAMNDRLGNTWTSYGYALSTTKIWSTGGPRIVVQGQVTFPGWRVNPRERILYQPGATLAYPSVALNADTIHASVVDQNGNVTKYRLDGFGAATEILTADGARATAQRDLEGRLIQSITPRGDTLDYTWSGPYLIQAVDRHATPGGSTTINTYSPAVSDVAFTGGHAYSTRTTRDGIVLGTSWFNAHGVLDSARVGPDTSKSVTRYVADTRGRVIQVTDPRGHQSLTVYQSSGFQNTDSTYAPADVPTDVIGTRWYYDTYGRVVATRDNRLNRDTTAYDLMNRVLYTAKGARTITNTYDRLFLTSVNTNGLVTTYAPNGHGWVDSVTNPLGVVTNSGFDHNGNVLTATNQRGQTVSATYDALDRPLSITADGSTRTFFYDPQGRWRGAVRGANIDTIKTDIAGRDSVVVTVRGSRVYTQRVGYAMNGQRATHRLSAGSYDQLTTWAYNSYGQLDTLVGPSQHVPTVLTYNEDGLNIGRHAQGLTFSTGFSGVHAPSGLSYGFLPLNREYAYELGTGFLSDRIQGDSGTLYGYDDLGQLKNVYRYGVTDPSQDCGTVSDLTGQITPACKTRRSVSMTTLSAIAYDGLGNRTDHGGQGYSLNNRQSYFNGTYFSYDGDGNISTKSGNGVYVVYTWSADGELKKATRFGWNANGQYVQDSTTFTYDGFGRRIRKSSLTTGVHEYLLDGDNLLAELDSAGGVRAQYTYYPGVDNPHSVLFPATGRTYNFATEAPGSVTGLTDTLGVLAASWSYDMWGVPTTLSGADSIQMPLRFAAREYDVETGLYYNRARYYDPQTGRFISEDPLGLAGGVNQYTYAGNNPVNATDPSGMKCSYSWVSVGTKAGEWGGYWASSGGDCTLPDPGSGFAPRPGGLGFGVSSAGNGGGGSSSLGATVACAVGAAKVNHREMDEAVDRFVGAGAGLVGKAVSFAGGNLASRGLTASGLGTTGNAGLFMRWMLGKSAGIERLDEVFGDVQVQGVKVGITSGGDALSGYAVGLGVATNIAAGIAVNVGYKAGTWIGSLGVGLYVCSGGH